jgi:hypothetical protein
MIGDSLSEVPNDLKRILAPDEKVEVYIKQKIYHPTLNISAVAITTERVILRHPHFLGLLKDYTDFNYKDISNVELHKGFLRSDIKLTLRFKGDIFELNDIPNSEAEKAYVIIRENVNRFQEPPGNLPYS